MLLIENVGSVEQITPLLPVTSKSCLAVPTSRKDLSLDIALGTGTLTTTHTHTHTHRSCLCCVPC